MEMPKQVGPFKVLRELGRGGMGGVFLAEDPRLGRKVALKILLPSRQEGSAGTARLLKEAKAAAKLEHPNVCAIYEVGESDSGTYIAMQYVEGETLDALLARSRPSLREVVSWGVQIAEALAEAHRMGIVHRDIKPPNLMITPKGQVKVLDFGLVKAIPQDNHFATTTTLLTQEGVVMGTVPYMSPEQVRNDALDGRSDLFSLGSVLFEAALGQRPFPALHSADLMSEILLKDPFSNGSGDHLPPGLKSILVKALQKKKADRYPSAEAMASDLRMELHVIQGTSGSSGDPMPTWTAGSGSQGHAYPSSGNELTAAVSSSRSIPALRKSRPWWLIGGLPLAYFAVPALLARHQGLDSIAVLPFVNATGDPEADYLCDGLTETLINRLSRLPGLKVIARSSSLRYKGRENDLNAIAKELGVKSVLMARLTRNKGEISLSVELADPADHRHLWGEQYRRAQTELMDLQDSLAREVVQNPADKRALAGGKIQANPEAYQLYLKGRYHADKWTPEDLGRAMAYFEQAIAKDPNFALAHVGVANAYWGMSGTFKPAAEAMTKVREEARKALDLDPDLAEAHTALGIATLVLDRDFPAAEASLKRGLALSPGSSQALAQYGYFLTAAGRKAEAYAMLDRAVELDPQSTNALMFRAIAFNLSRDYIKGLEDANRLLGLEPDFWFGHLAKADALFWLGQQEAALQSIERAVSEGSTYAMAKKGFILASIGRKKEAETLLTALENIQSSGKSFVSPLFPAYIQVGLNQKFKALENIKKSYDAREESSVFLKIDPNLDQIKEDPQFQALFGKSTSN